MNSTEASEAGVSGARSRRQRRAARALMTHRGRVSGVCVKLVGDGEPVGESICEGRT
jgi:hypothetical protein